MKPANLKARMLMCCMAFVDKVYAKIFLHLQFIYIDRSYSLVCTALLFMRIQPRVELVQ